MSRIEALQRMLAADPTNTMVRYGLANEFWKTGDYAAVAEQMETYLRSADDQGAGYRLLGQAFQKLGKIPEAREAYLAGQRAAERHGHPTMAGEIGELIEMLEA